MLTIVVGTNHIKLIARLFQKCHNALNIHFIFSVLYQEKRTAANTQSCRTPYVQTSEYALADWKLTLIPLVFILTRIWGSLRFLLILGERNDDKDVSRVFEIIAVVLSPFEVMFGPLLFGECKNITNPW